jgi:hypothetical protein
MLNLRNINRRKFIKTTAGAMAAASAGFGPLVREAKANTVLPDTRFDLTGQVKVLAENVRLSIWDERLQSAAMGANNKLFTVQQPPGGGHDGALQVSYVTYDPVNDTINDYVYTNGQMLLTDFGHGQNFGVTWDGTDHWIWIECRAIADSPTSDGFGTQICKFKWKEGDNGTYSTKDIGHYSATLPDSYLFDQLQPATDANGNPTAKELSCSIDTISNCLLLRFYWLDPNNPPRGTVGYSGPTTGWQWAMYSLDDLDAAHANSALPTIPLFKGVGLPTIPDGQGGTELSSPFQGMTFMENFIYSISGTGWPVGQCTPSPDQGKVCILGFDLRNNNCLFTHVTAAQYLNIREPEGIWVHRTGSGQRLVFCLTSAATCTSGTPSPNKRANFYYIGVETNDLLSGCSLS